MRECDLEDERIAAAELAGAAMPARVGAVNTVSAIDAMEIDSCLSPSRRRARFAEVVDVQLYIIEDESEDEQSLEDYFGDWSESDKEAILMGVSSLDINTVSHVFASSALDHMAYPCPG
jgi:hypothetical protein